MPRSQNVLRLGQNRSLGPTGPDSAIGEGEGGQLDDIDQFARLDDLAVIGGIERISAPLLRERKGRGINQGNLRHRVVQR